MRLVIAFYLLLFSVHGSASPSDHMQGLNEPRHHEIESKVLGRALQILVRLPEEYAATDATFPATYLLDGGHMFPMLASYYRYLVFQESAQPQVIVGIAYGVDSFEDGNHRGSDFTVKAESAAHYGGAPLFLSFIEEELLPFLEREYRLSPKERVLFGQSLGGQFVLYTAQTRPDLFKGYIASNPALHRNLDYFLADHWTGGATGSRLYVSSGSLDDELYRTPALAWIDYWQSRPSKPWALKAESLEGHGHFSAAPEAFRRGLRWLYDGNFQE